MTQTIYTDRVFRAANDMLYLTGGTNTVTTLFTENGFKSNVDCDAWGARHQKRRRAVEALGGKFIQLIVPEKLSIYPLCSADQKLVFPDQPGQIAVAPGRRFVDYLHDEAIVYPDEFLREQTKSFPIYYATDSHWTWQGAFSAFQVLMFKLGYSTDDSGFTSLPIDYHCYHGDLYETHHAGIAHDRFERKILPSSIQRVYANSLMGLKERHKLENEGGLHNGSHCIFSNNGAQFQETVILFGSSFSEARLPPSLLTAIFASYFSNVHFIWSAKLDFDYISRHPAAIIVAEIPERFLNYCPPDDLFIEEFALARIRAWRNNPFAS